MGPLEVQPVLTDEPPSPPPTSFKIALTDDCFCSATTKLHETASSLEHGTHGYVHVSTGVLRDQKNQILELEFQVAVNCLIMGAGAEPGSSPRADFSLTTEPFLQPLHLIFQGRLSC